MIFVVIPMRANQKSGLWHAICLFVVFNGASVFSAEMCRYPVIKEKILLRFADTTGFSNVSIDKTLSSAKTVLTCEGAFQSLDNRVSSLIELSPLRPYGDAAWDSKLIPFSIDSDSQQLLELGVLQQCRTMLNDEVYLYQAPLLSLVGFRDKSRKLVLINPPNSSGARFDVSESSRLAICGSLTPGKMYLYNQQELTSGERGTRYFLLPGDSIYQIPMDVAQSTIDRYVSARGYMPEKEYFMESRRRYLLSSLRFIDRKNQVIRDQVGDWRSYIVFGSPVKASSGSRAEF